MSGDYHHLRAGLRAEAVAGQILLAHGFTVEHSCAMSRGCPPLPIGNAEPPLVLLPDGRFVEAVDLRAAHPDEPRSWEIEVRSKARPMLLDGEEHWGLPPSKLQALRAHLVFGRPQLWFRRGLIPEDRSIEEAVSIDLADGLRAWSCINLREAERHARRRIRTSSGVIDAIPVAACRPLTELLPPPPPRPVVRNAVDEFFAELEATQ